MKKLLVLMLAAAIALNMGVGAFAALPSSSSSTPTSSSSTPSSSSSTPSSSSSTPSSSSSTASSSSSTASSSSSTASSSSSTASSSSSTASSSSSTASTPISATGVIKDVDAKNFQAILKDNGTKKLILQDSTPVTMDKIDDLTVQPGQTIKIYLTANMFVDSAGAKIAVLPNHISRNQVRTGKIALRRSTSRGSKAFKSVGLTYDKLGTYIGIKMVDEFASLEDLEFATTIYLTMNGNRRDTTKITIAGTLSTDEVEVYNDDDYVDLAGGRVAKAVERVAKIEVDLGNDISIFTPMVRGRKYYGSSSLDPSAADIKLMTQYPGIREVYTLRTINLKPAGNAVSIDLGSNMYVYNASGAYLGTTSKLLPYSTKYYVSVKKYASIPVK